MDLEAFDISSGGEERDEHWSTNMDAHQHKLENKNKNNPDICNISDVSAASADTYMMPIEITNWQPCLFDDKLIICGIVAGSMQTERICEKRLSSLIFKDDNGTTCCILGPMKETNDLPDPIRQQFKYIHKILSNGEHLLKDGIPENWYKLCQIWRCFVNSGDKDLFDWGLIFKKFSYQTLKETNKNVNRGDNNGPKTKLKKKFDKYKSMLEQEILRDTLIVTSESDAEDVQVRRNYKPGTPTSSSIQSDHTSLNKRTTCYVNNQISHEEREKSTKTTVECQTELTQNDFMVNDLVAAASINEGNDENLSTNLTVLSPIKSVSYSLKSGSENYLINDQSNKRTKNESNKRIIASNTILQDLTNNDVMNTSQQQQNNSILVGSNSVRSIPSNESKKYTSNAFESNDETSPVGFYENIIANSTAINSQTSSSKQETCKKINYICSKTLERFANRPSTSYDTNVVVNEAVMDIDLFSQSIKNSSVLKNENFTTSDQKTVKTIRNNLEKSTTSTTNKRKGLKRKQQPESSDDSSNNNTTIMTTPESPHQSRYSLRKRKKINYSKLYGPVPLHPNTILSPRMRRQLGLPCIAKKTKKQKKTRRQNIENMLRYFNAGGLRNQKKSTKKDDERDKYNQLRCHQPKC